MAGACAGRGGSVPAFQTQRQTCKTKSAHGAGSPAEPLYGVHVGLRSAGRKWVTRALGDKAPGQQDLRLNSRQGGTHGAAGADPTPIHLGADRMWVPGSGTAHLFPQLWAGSVCPGAALGGWAGDGDGAMLWALVVSWPDFWRQPQEHGQGTGPGPLPPHQPDSGRVSVPRASPTGPRTPSWRLCGV